MATEVELAFFEVGNRMGELLVLSKYLRENTRETQHYAFLTKATNRLQTSIDGLDGYLKLDAETTSRCSTPVRQCNKACDTYLGIDNGLEPCLGLMRDQMAILNRTLLPIAEQSGDRCRLWLELGAVIVRGWDQTLWGRSFDAAQADVHIENWKWEDKARLDELVRQLAVDLESLFRDPQTFRDGVLGQPPWLPPLLWGCSCVEAARREMQEQAAWGDQISISVDSDAMTVVIEGKSFGVSEKAALWLEVLLKHPEGMTEKEVHAAVPKLEGVRLDRLKLNLPKEVRDLIESGSFGSRLNLSRSDNFVRALVRA
jgi:hypothetical protein